MLEFQNNWCINCHQNSREERRVKNMSFLRRCIYLITFSFFLCLTSEVHLRGRGQLQVCRYRVRVLFFFFHFKFLCWLVFVYVIQFCNSSLCFVFLCLAWQSLLLGSGICRITDESSFHLIGNNSQRALGPFVSLLGSSASIQTHTDPLLACLGCVCVWGGCFLVERSVSISEALTLAGDCPELSSVWL